MIGPGSDKNKGRGAVGRYLENVVFPKLHKRITEGKSGKKYDLAGTNWLSQHFGPYNYWHFYLISVVLGARFVFNFDQNISLKIFS